MPRVTLFDPANGFIPWDRAKDLAEATGLKPLELATFRVERLALHHVVIRVTAETHVPDGPNYADLGINLRSMAAEIFEVAVLPELDGLTREIDAMRGDARAIIDKELAHRIFDEPAPQPEPKGFLAGLFGKSPPLPPPAPPRDERALRASSDWVREAASASDPLHSACLRALARTTGAILSHRGALHLEPDFIADIAVNLVSNDHGDRLVSDRVAPLFDAAVETLGITRLPAQSDPVVLNAKGASASGKSSIRGEQRRIAETLGIDWQDFAVISPDYWRKLLIDYDSLGDNYKYAAMLTGQELEIIDRKLDALMAANAARGLIPHMLIDRFRFDSFQTGKSRAADSNLLTRFGARIYMFFLVTPPEETVVRAWHRGLATGRYKAVDDLLFHNIEAYSGMPDLFFAWAGRADRWVHYEFLDNSVPLGERPRTIAFGQNGTLVVRDLDKLCDIERFRHVDVDARSAESVLAKELSVEDAMAFARRAIAELDRVEFLVPGTDLIFARSTDGKTVIDADAAPASVPLEAFGSHEVSDTPLGTLDTTATAQVIGV